MPAVNLAWDISTLFSPFCLCVDVVLMYSFSFFVLKYYFLNLPWKVYKTCYSHLGRLELVQRTNRYLDKFLLMCVCIVREAWNRQLFFSLICLSPSLKSMQRSASKSDVTKGVVIKGKFLEWGSVKIINKQMMYKELGSAAPRSFISLSWFYDNSTPESHFHWVTFQESTYRCALL